MGDLKQGQRGGEGVQVDFSRLPRHVAVIMDGNGRWAKARHLPRAEGHRQGVQALHRLVERAAERAKA